MKCALQYVTDRNEKYFAALGWTADRQGRQIQTGETDTDTDTGGRLRGRLPTEVVGCGTENLTKHFAVNVEGRGWRG